MGLSRAASQAGMSDETKLGGDDLQAVERLREGYETIRRELGKVIVGQEEVIDELLISIFSRGHCLLVGVPGLAKTLLISSLANTLSLSFARIQFTPDLMPADITGTEILEEGEGGAAVLRLGFRMVKGLSEDTGCRIADRRGRQAFENTQQLRERTGVDRRELGALASAGALQVLEGHRHQARWAVAGVESPHGLFASMARFEPTLCRTSS